MNKGWIDVDIYGQYVVVEMNENHFEIEHPLHPFFKNKQFKVGELVEFQLAIDCSRHYPANCDCLKLMTFAFPVLKKKNKWFQIFRK